MNLNRLMIFREIVVTGSFSKAAAKLHQPKSRISRNLSALERELGVQLIHRTTRQFQLTPAGRELMDRAGPLLQQLENTIDLVSGSAEELAGSIKISVPDDIGVELMGGICHGFLQEHPHVTIDLHVSNLMVDLIRDSFDLAIRIGRLKDTTLIAAKVGQITLQPFAAPQVRQRFGERMRPEDLAEIPHLGFTAGGTVPRALTLHRRGENRKIDVKTVFSANNFFALRAMAIEGHGFAILPPFIVHDAVKQKRLVPLLNDWSLEGSPVQVVMPQQKEPPARTKLFVQHLKRELTELIS